MRVHSRGVKPPLKSDADALTKAPAAPAHLSPEAKAEWKRVMPQLIERRILTRGDLPASKLIAMQLAQPARSQTICAPLRCPILN